MLAAASFVPKLKAVIFDLDGTLADTLPMCIAAFRRAIEPHIGRSISDEEITATFGASEEGTIRSLIPQHYDAGVADYLAHYRALLHTVVPPGAALVETIRWLRGRGLPVGLVTGKGPHSCRDTLAHWGMEDCFDAVECGVPTGPRKPESLRTVLRQFDLAPHEAIYVGDTPYDIHACREVGVPIISAAWFPTADRAALEAAAPDALFDTPAMLRTHLQERLRA